MKNHSFKAEISIFLLTLFLFIVPSFFTNLSAEQTVLFTQWNFPFVPLCLAILGLCLYFFYKDEVIKFIIIPRFPVILTVGLLFCSALILKSISVLSGSENTMQNVLPSDILEWIFCILNFVFAAFYEEVLYRFYFTDSLFNILKRKFTFKYLGLICEITGALVFALAHLYLGYLAVINAIIGHIILRICYIKNKSLVPCVAAHFIYNVMSLILL